jgi:hypothetical protein
MEQTFNDLFNERQQQKRKGLFGFILWLFVETVLGVINEWVLLSSWRDVMKGITKSFGRAALISFILVAPFAILESLNHSITRQNALSLIVLFGLLWLLPMVFIIIVAPVVRNLRAGSAKPINLLLRVASLAFITVIWTGIVMDQLPCFLGVPNCD